MTQFIFQGWFEKYHDRVLEAELLLLTTLNFELNVEHPYTSLTSVLNKLDPSKTVLVNLALNLISKGWVFLFVGSYTFCNCSTFFACRFILWNKFVLIMMTIWPKPTIKFDIDGLSDYSFLERIIQILLPYFNAL